MNNNLKIRWYEYRIDDPEESNHIAMPLFPNSKYARVLQVWIDGPLCGCWIDVPIMTKDGERTD
jgi:hypothetical protein